MERRGATNGLRIGCGREEPAFGRNKRTHRKIESGIHLCDKGRNACAKLLRQRKDGYGTKRGIHCLEGPTYGNQKPSHSRILMTMEATGHDV